ncbi:Glutathione peroxidase [Gracilaria domingensis]|nr:Glutathione peroxidase [Gracilaria domingensis]
MRRGFKPDPKIPRSLFEATSIRDIDFEAFDFSTLEGKVVFVVNVASEDSRTDENYKMISDLLEEYHGSGLEVLAFPSNWYGQRETRPLKEIKKFVYGKYNKNIKLFTKTDLEWNEAFALGCHYFPGDIIWNFHGKFLFNRNGVPVGRYDLLTTYQFLRDEIAAQIQDGYGVEPKEIAESTEGDSDLADFVRFE